MNKKKRKKYAVLCEFGSVGTMTLTIRAFSAKSITLLFIKQVYKGATRILSVEEIKEDIVESAFVFE